MYFLSIGNLLVHYFTIRLVNYLTALLSLYWSAYMNARKCNPCEAISIVNKMGNISLEINCYSIFMPDRNEIFYNKKITTQPFWKFWWETFWSRRALRNKRHSIRPELCSKEIISKIKSFSYFFGWWFRLVARWEDFQVLIVFRSD